jgi:hypothetical protein
VQIGTKAEPKNVPTQIKIIAITLFFTNIIKLKIIKALKHKEDVNLIAL